MKRRALNESDGGENHADDGTMRANRLGCIMRATRRETTTAGRAKKNRECRRKGALINPDERKQREARQANDETRHGRDKAPSCDETERARSVRLIDADLTRCP
jgi:hypothetical protein